MHEAVPYHVDEAHKCVAVSGDDPPEAVPVEKLDPVPFIV